MPTDRRDFLSRLAAGAAVTAAGLPLSPALAMADEPAGDARVHALMAELLPAADEWDLTWTGKLTGQHRTIFDIPELEGGVGVLRAASWARHATDVLKAKREDLATVIVLRHNAIPLIMNHDYWRIYEVGKATKAKNPMTEKRTDRNPVLMTVEEDKIPQGFAGFMLDKQIANGAIVLGCNAAFAGCVSTVQKKDKLTPQEARTKAMSYIVPGVTLQPTGVFAGILAQKHGCAYVRAV